jgi:dihydroorotate dehydrogenase electron transfer subunit
MMKVLNEEIYDNEILAPDICRLKIKSNHISANALPGQFVSIQCCDGIEHLLRRPISICNVYADTGQFDIVFMIKGHGTQYLSKKRPGETINLIGPLGHGFHMPHDIGRVAVIGGGIGVFPLLFLLERLNENIIKHTYLGFRSRESVVLLDEFRKASTEVFVSSDDGSIGERGFVTDLLQKYLKEFEYDMIYTCGPTVMMKKIAAIATEENIPCQVSLEQRMGCGIGACLACACKTRAEKGDWEYSRVCSDGPVFWADRVVFE